MFLPLSGIFKISEEKEKRVKCHDGMCKLDNLFKGCVSDSFYQIFFLKQG